MPDLTGWRLAEVWTGIKRAAPELLKGPHGASKVLSTAIWDVVAVDAGEDDIADAPVCNGASRALRLCVIRRSRRTRRVHCAEPATPGACVACKSQHSVCFGVSHILADLSVNFQVGNRMALAM